uniref:Antitoxin of type II TA system, VapB n=1 Tax=Candidatus Kentrum sp. SD TaxID=2126332 RepID=A0A450YF46_9GAMM|nr:MAG: antitoxin of type II TA system, VapB [Candidatus Kentron sp. SD]VFK45723.1 MAG: antitoxin of type II TA system, VapB [Candidatus Kentron sp. SD]
MQTIINIDHDLLEQANRVTGLQDRANLIREALHALIARECARRFLPPGGGVEAGDRGPCKPWNTGKRRLGLLEGKATLRMENFEMTDEEFLRS